MSAVLQQAVARVWSEKQLNCFGDAAVGQGNTIIIAVAGAGKTTTGVEMVKRTKARGSHVYLAFNKSIATELSARGVNGMTFHSLAFKAVVNFFKCQVDGDKLHKLCERLLGDELWLYQSFVKRLVGLAKNSAVGLEGGVADTDEAWMGICDHHDLEPDSEEADIGRGIELARKVFDASIAETKSVDFDDMLYFAVKYKLNLPKYDSIFLDEAQDTNLLQILLVWMIMKETSRLFAIGDPAQAIYGFRGADSNSMNSIKRAFACKELPLTVSYRCSKAVVAFVRQWVDHIEAAPNAPEGAVHKLGRKWDHRVFQANDLVVCRVTAPLITLAYKLLTNHVPVMVMGRDIGAGLKALIKKLNARGIDQLETKLAAWRERETKKAEGKESKVQAIGDKADCISCLIGGLQETKRTIPELLRVIDDLFADKANAVRLSTIHKAKGLESRNVFWLNSSKCPSKWARQDWQKEQEINLCYVAGTRAKTDLYLIEDEDGTATVDAAQAVEKKFLEYVEDRIDVLKDDEAFA